MTLPNANGLVVMQSTDLEAMMRSLMQEQAETIVSTIIDRQQQAHKTDEIKYLTRNEAAKRLRISVVTLQKRLNDGNIEFKRLGRRVLIPETALPQ